MIAKLLLASLVSTLAQEPPDPIAFVGVSVHPLDSERSVPDQVVVVHGDRIAAIGKRGFVTIPDGAQVVDGTGKFLLPGLCDMHIHLRHAKEDALLRYLRAGVTTAREMNGRPFLLEWRDQIRNGSLQGPDLFVAAPTIGNWSSPKEGFPTPKTAAEARQTVRGFAEQGYDWIKFYSFVPKLAFIELVAEAKRQGIPVGGHIPVESSLEEALEIGIDSIEHLTGYLDAAMTEEARNLDEDDFRGIIHAGEIEADRLEEVIHATVASGVWNCPTVLYFDRILPTDMVRSVWRNPKLRKLGERNRRLIVKELWRAGAPLVLGTDSDDGDDLEAATIHDEIAAMADAGLPPLAILQSATVRAAEFLGQSEEIGSVAVGKRADLLLVDGNPLENLSCLRSPAMVMARGRVVER